MLVMNSVLLPHCRYAYLRVINLLVKCVLKHSHYVPIIDDFVFNLKALTLYNLNYVIVMHLVLSAVVVLFIASIGFG